MSVCYSVHGGSASVHAWIAYPPGADTPQGADTPRSRHPPGADPSGTDTPPDHAPSGADTPCTVHAERYGQQAGDTHPTGMHTCYKRNCSYTRLRF